ncbi:hypothetical protein FI667_g3748, partial [Globisporangium splendens]
MFVHFTRLESAFRNTPHAVSQQRGVPYAASSAAAISSTMAIPTELETLDDRSRVTESVMYLMNVTMLTDPVQFVSWRWYAAKTLVGVYRSNRTQRVYLVPMVHASRRTGLSWTGFDCLAVVPANELLWGEIITCG